MAQWWSGLSALNRVFYVVAIFFSTIFGWQFISSLSGLGGEGDADVGHDLGGDGMHMDVHADGHDLVDDSSGLDTFRHLSVRSILAFCTLFTWAGALYLGEGGFPGWAILRAFLWGLGGMFVVALFFWLLPRLTEEGTEDLDTAIGRTGEVYVNIPEGGIGRVKVIVSGALRFVPARSKRGQPLQSGTVVRVVGRVDSSTLEVDEAEV